MIVGSLGAALALDWPLHWNGACRGASFFFNEFHSVPPVFFTLTAGVARAGDAPQNKTVFRRLEAKLDSSLPKTKQTHPKASIHLERPQSSVRLPECLD